MTNFFEYVISAVDNDTNLEYEIDPSHDDPRINYKMALKLLSTEILEGDFTEYVSDEWPDKARDLLIIRLKLEESTEKDIAKTRLCQKHGFIELILFNIILVIEGLIISNYYGNPRYELSCLMCIIGIIYAPFHFFSRLNSYFYEYVYHVVRAKIFNYAILLIDMYTLLGHAGMMDVLKSRREHRNSSPD